MERTSINPTRKECYSEWYQQVIIAADLAENSPVRGCMVIKPWGYAIWENIQQNLDRRFKETGHINAYFPLFIPLNYLEKEAKHVESFAKECAVVTHHRLVNDGKGGLIPDGKLEEPLVIRPTSESMVGSMYAKWIRSYRDLPILINQWANVVRWELRTRLFLRTTEFLWQEGHTAHATRAEAMSETLMILNLYSDFAENVLAMPVIKGEKTISERFPGAITTYSIEAMMQDYKALQVGTSHFLGQNFARAFEIQFLNKTGHLEHVWTTSWGVSTRLIGGLIMTHSDDNGLVLPPKIAPYQIVILPIYRNNEDKQKVLSYCEYLQEMLREKIFHNQPIRVHIDNRDFRGGEKNWQWIKKGVPILLEIGMRDVINKCVIMKRRDMLTDVKQSICLNTVVNKVPDFLNEIQNNLFMKAKKYRDNNSFEFIKISDFNSYFTTKNSDKNEIQAGFASCYAIDNPIIDQYLKPLKVTARCIPINQEEQSGKCIFTGKHVNKKTIFARAY